MGLMQAANPPMRGLVGMSMFICCYIYPGLMMIFPFLPFMIHDFFPELSRQELGKVPFS